MGTDSSATACVCAQPCAVLSGRPCMCVRADGAVLPFPVSNASRGGSVTNRESHSGEWWLADGNGTAGTGLNSKSWCVGGLTLRWACGLAPQPHRDRSWLLQSFFPTLDARVCFIWPRIRLRLQTARDPRSLTISEFVCTGGATARPRTTGRAD